MHDLCTLRCSFGSRSWRAQSESDIKKIPQKRKNKKKKKSSISHNGVSGSIRLRTSVGRRKSSGLVGFPPYMPNRIPPSLPGLSPGAEKVRPEVENHDFRVRRRAGHLSRRAAPSRAGPALLFPPTMKRKTDRMPAIASRSIAISWGYESRKEEGWEEA